LPLPRASALPDKLPVVDAMPALRAALSGGHAVLVAEPGSGKTTLVPLLLLDEDWLAGRRIVMLEPRRPAARMAAARMARLCNETIGQTVGYQVRFERRLSAATRIEVVTEGLLVRRIQGDPELSDVGLVIFDEFHERNLQGDLSLALCLDVVRSLRQDLRLLVMSATLDPEPICRWLPAEAICAPGRTHPIEVSYDRSDAQAIEAPAACVRLTERALNETTGDVLVFLPGRSEIERYLTALAASGCAAGIEQLPLHGQLDRRAQDLALDRAAAKARRVIAATDIAETSVTIDGVSAVVDSGFARRPRFVGATGLTRLETQRISCASADQRAGRAGRLGPGRAYRAWTPARHSRLPLANQPEIASADLAPLALEIAAWGAQVDELQWLTRPPEVGLRRAFDLLRGLGALREDGRITPQGRRMVRLPAHPRLAHLLVQAPGEADQSLAADIAALLSERDPLSGDSRRHAGADIEARLDVLTRFRRAGRSAEGDPAALRQVERAAAQFRRLVTGQAGGSGLTPGVALLLAYPDRIGQLSPGDGRRYLLRTGRAARLAANDPLLGTPYLVAASIDAGDREGLVHLAAPVSVDEIEEHLSAQIESLRELRWDGGVDDVVARQVRRLGAIALQEREEPLRPDDDLLPLIVERIGSVGLDRVLKLPRELLSRVARMRRLEPGAGWPDYSPQGLTAGIDDWLGPWLSNGGGLRAVRKTGVESILANHLGRERLQRLDDALPTHITTPAGTRRRISYPPDGDPILALPMQELFGERAGPRLAGGQVSLVLHLLSPAGRPLQITSDLAAFWAGAYADVKKEMRGRYPKHHWPDDPAGAAATRSLKRR
jgi:ATP-dependent helicase HrpB